MRGFLSLGYIWELSEGLWGNKILNQITMDLDCLPLFLCVDKSRGSWKEAVTGPGYLATYCHCPASSLLALHKLFLCFIKSSFVICEVKC